MTTCCTRPPRFRVICPARFFRAGALRGLRVASPRLYARNSSEHSGLLRERTMVGFEDVNDESERPCRLPSTGNTPAVGETIAMDQHYTPAELSKFWHYSQNTIRRIFAEEPGVLKITAASPSRNPRRRRMVQLRIPARVAMRVHARLSK